MKSFTQKMNNFFKSYMCEYIELSLLLIFFYKAHCKRVKSEKINHIKNYFKKMEKIAIERF